MLGFFCIVLRMKSLAADEKDNTCIRAGAQAPVQQLEEMSLMMQLPDSEMSSQKGESNSYCAFMILENSLLSLSS